MDCRSVVRRWCIRVEGGGARTLSAEAKGVPAARMPKAETGHGKEGNSAANNVGDNAGGINSPAKSCPGVILAQPDTGALSVLGHEYDAGGFQRGAEGGEGNVSGNPLRKFHPSF